VTLSLEIDAANAHCGRVVWHLDRQSCSGKGSTLVGMKSGTVGEGD
jgi:hypothetical protein